MPIDGFTGDAALAFFAGLGLLVVGQCLLAKLCNRPVLILGRFAVVLVDFDSGTKGTNILSQNHPVRFGRQFS